MTILAEAEVIADVDSGQDEGICLVCACSVQFTLCGRWGVQLVAHDPDNQERECPDCVAVWWLSQCGRCGCSYRRNCGGRLCES